MATALPVCIVAVPLVISYFSSSSEYIATAEVPHPADNVYAAVVREVEGPELGVTTTKKDDAGRLLEINDGVQTATIKVIEEEKDATQIIVTASKGKAKRQKEPALQVLLHLCRQYGEECKVREQLPGTEADRHWNTVRFREAGLTAMAIVVALRIGGETHGGQA